MPPSSSRVRASRKPRFHLSGWVLRPPTPSLGVLINEHFDFVALQWTAVAIPTAILAVHRLPVLRRRPARRARPAERALLNTPRPHEHRRTSGPPGATAVAVQPSPQVAPLAATGWPVTPVHGVYVAGRGAVSSVSCCQMRMRAAMSRMRSIWAGSLNRLSSSNGSLLRSNSSH